MRRARRSPWALGAALALLVSFGVALRVGAAAGDRVLVLRVVDGDTIRVQRGADRVTVRLIGVDAPETHHPEKGAEPFGEEATDFARRRLDGRWVRLEYEEGARLDKYGRTLAYVRLDDGTLFNREIIRAGWAETFRRFPFRYKSDFQSAERRARAEGRGMWATSGRAAGPVIGNRRSRVYHLPGQRDYGRIAERNRVYFSTVEEAEAAGYRPSKR
jgi:micrococcal nuclease